ncbi:MAG: lipocalin family protein [Flavipsychrobacter sp.]
MKLNKALIVTCLSFATLLSAVSCKKSSTNKLVGTWKLNQTGTDLNGNGMIDAGEMASFDSTGMGAIVTFTFNSNGTGSERIVFTGFLDSSASFKWTSSNGNKDLTLSDQSGNSELFHVSTLSSTDLVLADTANPIDWLAFKKQ